MAKYLVETPHRAEQCLAALDEVVKYDVGLLDRTYFGCMSGDHTGWAFVDAESESVARDTLPPALRADARVVGVGSFTREQIEGYHKG